MTLTRGSIVLISLCIGLLCAALTFRYLSVLRVREAKRVQPMPVVVTTRPIAARTIITPSDVQVKMVPAALLPADCATSLNEVAGQVALSSLRAEVPVPRKAVATRDATLGMAYMVPAGMRAVAVALDPIIGVAGFLKPGDRVDVLTTISIDDLKVTKTVLQDVTLLAIGPTVRSSSEQSTMNQNEKTLEEANATLAVTPDQAEKLILSETDGHLRLTLRPADDRAIVVLKGIRSDQLTSTQSNVTHAVASAPRAAARPRARAAAAPTASAAPRPAAFSIETIRGTERSTIQVNPN
jgi:pilus assembly protein CpaB